MAEEIKSENNEIVETTDKSGKTDKADKSDKKAKKTAMIKTANKSVKEKPKLGERIKKFIKDYRSELKKIVWPTRAQVIKNTGVVLVAIIFMSIVIGLLDLLFGLGLQGLAGIKNLIGGGG
jgi:preprotein translocase subunit SecE